MSSNERLSIEDLEATDELTDEELRQISGGTLRPDQNGYVKVTRNGETVMFKPKAVEILTPDEQGRV